MSKKVDVTFMRFVMNDADWKREVLDAGDKVLCGACSQLSNPHLHQCRWRLNCAFDDARREPQRCTVISI